MNAYSKLARRIDTPADDLHRNGFGFSDAIPRTVPPNALVRQAVFPKFIFAPHLAGGVGGGSPSFNHLGFRIVMARALLLGGVRAGIAIIPVALGKHSKTG